MSLTLIGKKRGMTRIFCSKTGKNTPCTIIEIQPNLLVQSKTIETDGYEAVKLAAFALSEKQKRTARKPDLGHYKDGMPAMRTMVESKGSLEGKKPGDLIDLTYFSNGSFVDVRGTTKGRGYAGVIKRFRVGSIVKSHGAGPVVRHLGSTGSLTSHGRVQKGKKGAGQMGAVNRCTEGLEVLEMDAEHGILVVKGGIPGANGGTVYVCNSIKGKK